MKNVINIWIIFYLHIVLCVRCGSKCPFDILVLPHSARGPQQLLLLRELSFFTGREGCLFVMVGRQFFLVSPFVYGKKVGPPFAYAEKSDPLVRFAH